MYTPKPVPYPSNIVNDIHMGQLCTVPHAVPFLRDPSVGIFTQYACMNVVDGWMIQFRCK